MPSSRFLESLSRIHTSLRAFFARRMPAQQVVHAVAFAGASSAPAQVAVPVAVPLPVAVAVVQAPIAVATAATVEAPEPFKKMRTLEEVRADLARLRESAKERHAMPQVVRRDISFAPTDFMDIPEPMPMPKQKPQDSFASTAFFDFSGARPA